MSTSHSDLLPAKTLLRLPILPAVLALLLLAPYAYCEDPPAGASTPGSVNTEILKAKIEEVEAATGMKEEAKTKLVELHRKALSNLQTASSNAQAAEEFQRAAETAPAELLALQEEMEESSQAAPEDTLEADLTTPLRQTEQLLQKEKADLAAVDARRADFEKRLAEEAARPAQIRQLLTDAKQRQEEVAAQLKLPPPAGEGPATVDALRWVPETRNEALSTEIGMLDQELLSQPMRVDLLKAKRDKATASVQWVGARIKVLEDLVNRKRQAEAKEAKAHAEETRREAKGKHPLVIQLAEDNATLSEEIAGVASRLQKLAEQSEQADKQADQIEDDFKSARETIDIGGLSQELGHMLLQQRQSLPDLNTFRRQTKEREDQAAETGLRRLHHRRDAKQLQNPDEYVAGIAAGTALEETPGLHGQLRNLAMERKTLLAKAVESDDLYLSKLTELETAQGRLLNAIETYNAFLAENLLWIRSTSRTRLEALGALPEQAWRIISPTGWLEVIETLVYQATHSPVFVLLAVALGTILWGRRRVIAAIRAIGDKVGKPSTDRFVYSLQALVLTLVAASAWPLVMAVTGWQLKISLHGTDFSTAVGESLLAVATQFFFLRAFRMICMPGGLAAAHFLWPETSLRLLRRVLDRLTWIYLPAAQVTIIAFFLDPLNVGWEVGRAAFLIMVGTLVFAFYRLLQPMSGVLAGYMRRPERKIYRQLQRLWYPLLVMAPLALGVLSVMGYVYTAGTLLQRLLSTTWLAVVLVMISALAVRWLLVTRRRLAYEAALERRQKRLEEEGDGDKPHSAKESTQIEFEEPEVDLAALSDTSRKLLNTALLFYGIFGLWVIWSDVFPAFHILDEIALWHQTLLVDGEEKVLPVTLADIGLALIYLVVTVILAKRLPAVLEIVLLERFDMPSGNRYTATTLTTYAIVAIGLSLSFSAMGIDWSKLQWLIAALGVGIGFGLQEIVANFISGIILLFERPIRVGDFVTVGTTDGVVSRIRIRATTIRNTDGKELLVPNKEFITGRLLNWSLSDQTTRLLISVGIAYGSNVREAMRLLEEAAREHEDVLDDPAPSVIFQAFGDNSLTMLLRCFVDSVDVRYPTISALNQAINDKFNKAGISIAFPQRDLHLDTARPLQVELRRGREAPPAQDPGDAT